MRQKTALKSDRWEFCLKFHNRAGELVERKHRIHLEAQFGLKAAYHALSANLENIPSVYERGLTLANLERFNPAHKRQ